MRTVTHGMKKLQPTVRSTVETCHISFDPCVVNHVGFFLARLIRSPLYVLHVVHLVCYRLLNVPQERVQDWVRHCPVLQCATSPAISAPPNSSAQFNNTVRSIGSCRTNLPLLARDSI